MKKCISTMLVLILLFVLILPASAAPSEKNTAVAITASALKVNVGESVNLTAVTIKHGSEYSDSWTQAACNGTYLDASTDSYCASAVFRAERPGTYKVEYTIVMKAGKSETRFVGRGSCTIEVEGKIELVGAEIRNVSVKPLLRTDGSIWYYSASGTVYSLWSDNSSKVYGTIFFSFGAGETSKSLSVTITDSRVARVFSVVVQR